MAQVLKKGLCKRKVISLSSVCRTPGCKNEGSYNVHNSVGCTVMYCEDHATEVMENIQKSNTAAQDP